MNEQMKVLEDFDEAIKQCLLKGFIKEINEDIFYFQGSTDKTMALLAATHGEEPIGLKVFTEILKKLLFENFESKHSFYLILSHRKAYEENVRFIEEDLNRSFHLQGSSYEGERAKIIAKALDRCQLSLDIHQTVHETSTGFWIVNKLASELTLLSNFEKILPCVLAPDGDTVTTSRSYMSSINRIGLTLELSDFGFEPEAVFLGEKILKKTLNYNFETQSPQKNDLYEMFYHASFPGGYEVKWKEGLRNFDQVKKGERLGSIDGENILSHESGRILLYPAHFFKWKKQPVGLYSLCKKI